MKLTTEASPLSKKGMGQIAAVALTYWFFLALTKYTLSYVPGLEFRIATFVPVVGGILFGLPGAIGAAVGNLLGDLGGNDILPARICGVFFNFFLAYLPYRLWYGLKSEKASLLVYDQKSFGAYILLNVFAGLNTAIFLCLAINLFYAPAIDRRDLLTLFANNFFYPVIVGIPLLLLVKGRVENRYYPSKENPHKYGGYQRYVLMVLVVMETMYAAACIVSPVAFSQEILLLLLGLLIVSNGYICTIPSAFEPEKIEYQNYNSLVSKATIALLLTFITIILIGMVLTLLELAGKVSFSDYDNWVSFNSVVILVISTVLTLVYVIMGDIERNISQPLVKLSQTAFNYTERRAMAADGVSAVENELDMDADLEEGRNWNEVVALKQSFRKMSSSIDNYVKELTAAAEKKHALESQMEIASKIQRGLFPKLDKVNEWLRENSYPYRIMGNMKAASRVGGNMYDCYLVDDNHLLITVGNVSSNGIPAALFIAVTQALLGNSTKNKAGVVGDLSSIVYDLNVSLIANNREKLHVKLWVGLLELDTGNISYVNADHDNAVIKQGSDYLDVLELASGPVLGVERDAEYVAFDSQLPEDGDLLLFSDGFVNAQNENKEVYSFERMTESFMNSESPEEMLQDFEQFIQNAPYKDDVTYIWISRR